MIRRLPGVAVLLPAALILVVLGTTEPTALIAASVVVLIATAAAGRARELAAAARPRVLTVGARARRHRHPLDRIAEPSHPGTRGRILSRAPGRVLAAA